MFAHAGKASVDELTGQPGPRTLAFRRPDGALDHRGAALHAGAQSRAIVAESPVMLDALQRVQQVAPTSASVLLLGETGVGKDVFAGLIHDLSPRRAKPMVRVNCGAIPTTLMESELFGHERGAFTGASSRQIGRFEAAHHSTLFLDEVAELTAEDQTKLLRVLQDRVIERLGSARPISIDVRVIAATNKDLEQAVAAGQFREDLYYRLNVFPITIAPLRERRESIPALAWGFVQETAAGHGKAIDAIDPESMRALEAYHWPGNIRELRNVVERAVIMAKTSTLRIALPAHPVAAATGSNAIAGSMTLKGVEALHIRATLDHTGWRVRGKGGAADLLGMKPTTLETRMAKLGIVRPGRQQG